MPVAQAGRNGLSELVGEARNPSASPLRTSTGSHGAVKNMRGSKSTSASAATEAPPYYARCQCRTTTDLLFRRRRTCMSWVCCHSCQSPRTQFLLGSPATLPQFGRWRLRIRSSARRHGTVTLGRSCLWGDLPFGATARGRAAFNTCFGFLNLLDISHSTLFRRESSGRAAPKVRPVLFETLCLSKGRA